MPLLPVSTPWLTNTVSKVLGKAVCQSRFCQALASKRPAPVDARQYTRVLVLVRILFSAGTIPHSVLLLACSHVDENFRVDCIAVCIPCGLYAGRSVTGMLNGSDGRGVVSEPWSPASNAPPAENGTRLRSTNPRDAVRATLKTARSAASPTSCAWSTIRRRRNSSSPPNWNERAGVRRQALGSGLVADSHLADAQRPKPDA